LSPEVCAEAIAAAWSFSFFSSAAMRSASDLDSNTDGATHAAGNGTCAFAFVTPTGGQPANTTTHNPNSTFPNFERISRSPVSELVNRPLRLVPGGRFRQHPINSIFSPNIEPAV